jgi:SOS-response transcriptional repressor LexA
LDLGDSITLLISSRGLNQTTFAEALSKHGQHYDKTHISKYVNGKVKPKPDFYKAIFTEFGITMEEVMTGSWVNRPFSKSQRESDEILLKDSNNKYYPELYKSVKVYGRVDAGLPTESWTNFESELFLPTSAVKKMRGNPVGFKVVGDSMEGRFSEGDIVIATEILMPNDMPKDREFVVVWFKSDGGSAKALLKKFLWADKKKKSFMLESSNPAFNTQYHEIKDVIKIFRVQLAYLVFNKNLL